MRGRFTIDEREYDNISLDRRVGFIEQGHKYIMIDNPGMRFKSVTGLVSSFKEAFDAEAKAQQVVANPRSKYFGRDWNDVVAEWNLKGMTAADQGTILHIYGEYLLNDTPPPEIPDLPKAQYVPLVVEEIFSKGYTVAKTEILLYSEVISIAGQSDILLKKDDYFAIYDWKFLSKPIQKNSYYNTRSRKYKKLSGPFKYLDDCNWIHYSIQTAIYQTLTGEPERVREKVLIVVTDNGYTFEACYPMRVFWDEDNELQAVYEVWDAQWYDSRTGRITKKKPKDIIGL